MNEKDTYIPFHHYELDDFYVYLSSRLVAQLLQTVVSFLATRCKLQSTSQHPGEPTKIRIYDVSVVFCNKGSTEDAAVDRVQKFVVLGYFCVVV